MCILILVLDNDLKKLVTLLKRYNLHATIPTVKPAHPKPLLVWYRENVKSAEGNECSQYKRRAAKHELCPALVSLVFLHIFCGLAQFCKKPCNPVFNVLLFF